MKKKYSSKLAWMGATLCAFLLVACGLKISNVTLSTHELEANGEVTITTSFINPDPTDNGWGDNEGNYLLYAVRVPADWAAADVLSAVSSLDETYEFVESKPYATLAEFCFPKEGYKWIAFQTPKPCDVTIMGGDDIVSTLTLKAGEKAGDYKLDVISGAIEADPAQLLNADGTVNLDKAFGMKRDLSEVNGHKNYDGQNVYALSLYLVCTTTFSSDELATYGKLHLSETVTHNDKEDDGFGNITFEGEMTLPVCATADIQNNLSAEELAALNLNVKVNGESAVNEIAVSEKDNAPVYNLQGVKVADTTVPGIYVKNGKKFVVK